MPTLLRPTRAQLQTAGWLLFAALVMGFLSGTQLALADMGRTEGYTFGHALIMQTPFWVLWVPLIPLIVWVARRWPIERNTVSQYLADHLAAGLAISLLHYGIQLYFMSLIGHGVGGEHSFVYHFFWQMRFNLAGHLVGYATLLVVVLVTEYYRKYREREVLASQLAAQLYQAKLVALRMQLNPHFLFNAMNSIAMLVRKSENTQAVKTIAGLSDLLRYVLEDSPADEVPLREEIGFIERYLSIEQIRFQNRLRVCFDVPEDVQDGFVPNLILQPLVENAVRHGVSRKLTPGTIEVVARVLGDRLLLQVRDDGPGLTGEIRGTGVGLENTRRRLQQLYGTQHSFELRNADSDGTVATVSLPWHTRPLASMPAEPVAVSAA